VTPRHSAIAERLRDRIRRGELAPGDSIPSEAELCRAFGVSRGTVRQALTTLRAEGLLVGGRGKPPVVRRAGLAQSFDQLLSFSAWAHSLGRTPGARTLELTRRPASAAVADHLAIEPGELVYEYVRVRTLDGAPIMIERPSWIERVGRELLDADLDGSSVYAHLASRGVVFAEGHQRISALAADAEDAELLEVEPGAPLLEVQRLAVDHTGRPLEFSHDRYRGDAFSITLHVDVDPRSGIAYGRSTAA
jgi:GntR family transcriptional regulator